MPQIEVAFDIDANGILNVSAKDKATSKEQSIRIEASSGLSSEEIDRMQQEAEEHASEDQARRAQVDARNEADQLVYATEKSLSEYGEQLSEEDRVPVEAALSALKEALSGEDAAAIASATETLKTASHKLAEVMYAASQAAEGAGGEGPEPPPSEAGTPPPSQGQDGAVDADFEVVDDSKEEK